MPHNIPPGRRRLIMLLGVLLLFCALSPAALAANVTVSTVNGTNYFQTYASNGAWVDIGTPQHSINETGQVAYCLQTDKDSPYNTGYSSAGAYDILDETALTGLRAILENGYPASSGGFPDDQARYATANAIRFWLAERGVAGMPSWMNYNAYSWIFRAKSGYQGLFDWCISLLRLAENQSVTSHSVGFSSGDLTLNQSGDRFTGQVSVYLINCNGGYSLDTSHLPAGSSITGYSGNDGDTLTISIPEQYAQGTYPLYATGRDNRSLASLFFYAPNAANQQRVVTYDLNTFGEVGTAGTTIRTPAAAPRLGNLTIYKRDAETNAMLPGVGYRLYDAGGTLVREGYTDGSGVLTFTDLPAGNYTYAEFAAPAGYYLDTTSYPVTVTAGQTAEASRVNTPIKATLTVHKRSADTLTPLEGAGFRLYDAGGTQVREGYTDGGGNLAFGDLPLGSYTLREFAAPEGFLCSEESWSFSFTDAHYTEEITLDNSRKTASITVNKVNAAGAPLQGVALLLEVSPDGGQSWSAVSQQLTDEAGCVAWPGLVTTPGTLYRLTETSTAPGQTLQTEPIYLGTLPENGNYDVVFTVCNCASLTLPFTGGGGFGFIPVSLLMLGMGIFLIWTRKKKEAFA